MYASDRRQDRDYQDRRDRDRGDSRYVSDETFYYRGPDAGAVVMRGSDPYNNARGYEVQQYQQPQYDNLAGGLIGGLLGNQVQKGKKYDTVATIAGAVVGGIGAREISEQWDKRKERREERAEKWDEKYGDDRDRRRNDQNDRYDDRRRYNDRDWR
ncbi:hypothetical protein N0V86_009529 [Didymella sp. IMI 355093]|nr:hypothetical protein N0V86_009529 [Didymella sp. IMI 355093]